MVKFLGGKRCDPTGEKACNLEKLKKVDRLCEVCKLFGCTGYASRFRLEITGGAQAPKGGIQGNLSCNLIFPYNTEEILKEKTFACLLFVFMYGQVGGKTSKQLGKLSMDGQGLPVPSLGSIQSISDQVYQNGDAWFLDTVRKDKKNCVRNLFKSGEKKSSIIHRMIL